MSVAITVPDALKVALEEGGAIDFSKWALEAIVLEAVREGCVTRGEGGELLGLGFHEREAFYASRGVTYDLSDKEREHERADMARVFAK